MSPEKHTARGAGNPTGLSLASVVPRTSRPINPRKGRAPRHDVKPGSLRPVAVPVGLPAPIVAQIAEKQRAPGALPRSGTSVTATVTPSVTVRTVRSTGRGQLTGCRL